MKITKRKIISLYIYTRYVDSVIRKFLVMCLFLQNIHILLFVDALLKVARHEGIAALWNGTLPSVVLASNPSVQFMVYEAVKRYFQSLLKTKVIMLVLTFLIIGK